MFNCCLGASMRHCVRVRRGVLISLLTGLPRSFRIDMGFEPPLCCVGLDTMHWTPDVGNELRVRTPHGRAAGGLFRLPRKLPFAVAMELCLTGDPMECSRAYQLVPLLCTCSAVVCCHYACHNPQYGACLNMAGAPHIPTCLMAGSRQRDVFARRSDG